MTNDLMVPVIIIAVSISMGIGVLALIGFGMLTLTTRATEALEKIERRLYRMTQEEK